MKWNFWKSDTTAKTDDDKTPSSGAGTPQPESNDMMFPPQGIMWPIQNRVFDGEKNPGELGIVTRNILDYHRLRLRSYDAYITNDSIKIVISKHFKWTIGSGLKLQAEPNDTIIKALHKDWNKETFKTVVEARWEIFANSKYADFSREKTLHQLAREFYKAKKLGGDCLIIARFDKFGPNFQFVSGEFVQTPFDNQDGHLKGVEARGNYIAHGIEFNDKGEHISYFVRIKDKSNFFGKFERIPARGEKTGRRLAWMLYNEQVSLDHKRGIPSATPVLEKAAKLDRYTEASVSKAEHAAKILNTIEHLEYSDGSNPLEELVNKKLKIAGKEVDGYELSNGIAKNVAASTGNTTINMVPGSQMKSFGTTIETDFADFESANFEKIAAGMDVPPEVALQKYTSSYSASRAAQGAWGFTLDLDRNEFSNEFYRPIYALWLEDQVLNNYVDAPGFLLALKNDDYMIVESYTKSRFIGKNMPHIDPVKEVKAVRELLGDDRTPLISREQGAESLNLGDWTENFNQYQEEQKIIPIPEPTTEPIKTNAK